MVSPEMRGRIAPEIAAWLKGMAALRCDTRADSDRPRELAGIAVSELWRWRTVQEIELARQRWTLDELEVIAAATQGTPASMSVPTTMGHMAAAVFDARRLGEVDDDEATMAVIDRLAGLSAAGDIALELAVARWWADRLPHTVDGWAHVGVAVETASDDPVLASRDVDAIVDDAQNWS